MLHMCVRVYRYDSYIYYSLYVHYNIKQYTITTNVLLVHKVNKNYKSVCTFTYIM